MGDTLLLDALLCEDVGELDVVRPREVLSSGLSTSHHVRQVS
ncbi:hypothetical protein [Streptomyces sp. Root369]|nr:hypothetical protein [Streptomyces sp. Root369]